MAEVKRSSGIVRWFSAQKGFGFIAPDDAGEDLFVHQTSILSEGFRTLFDDQAVEFAIDYDDDQRPKAVDVTVIDGSTGVRGGRGAGRARARGYGRFGEGGGYGRGGAGAGRGFDRGGRYDGPSGGFGGGGRGGGECYNCGQMGHLARDCYRGNGGAPPNRGRGRGYGGGRGYDSGGGVGGGGRGYAGDRGYGNGGGGGRSGGGCYNCGDTGHFARDCQNES